MIKKFFRTDLVSLFSFAASSLFVILAIIKSLTFAIDVPIFHLDGAFQTASGLFRLEYGHFPGKDFFPYLGIGPIFLLYPAFKIAGANLASSVFATRFMMMIMAWISVSILWQLVFRHKCFRISMAFSAIYLFIALETMLPFPHFSYHFMIYPDNSLRPIRSILPYCIIAIYYLFILQVKVFKWRIALSGLLTGLAMLWSNDYALTSTALFMSLVIFNLFERKELNWRVATIYCVAALVAWIVLLSIVTVGHPSELLKYNFLDVSVDQWWYFGPYEESKRIFFHLYEIPKIIELATELPIFILLVSILFAVKTKLIEHVLIAWIGVALLAGGLVACIGGHLDSYFGGFIFWGWTVLTLFIAHLISCIFLQFFPLFFTKKIKLKDHQLISTILISLFFYALPFQAWSVIQGWNIYNNNIKSAERDSKRFYVEELGGFLEKEWSSYINLARQTKIDKVIEEYWGLWSATRKASSDYWPVDSLIHALGDVRKLSPIVLKNSEIVITTRYSLSKEWQPWSVNSNFWFYDELLSNWTPKEISPTTVVWYKNKQPNLSLDQIECVFDESRKSLKLKAKRSGFYKVEMDYALSGQGRFLVMIRNNFVYADDSDGYTSIDPNGRNAKFLVYLFHKGDSYLDFKLYGNKKRDLKVNYCNASLISFSHKEVLRIPDRKSFMR